MKMIKAIVGIANGIAGDILIYATDGLAAPFVEAWNKSLKAIGDAVGDSDIEHKRRDPYGKDPGTGDTGKHEGGLIVCMPGSGGAIYATDDYYFQDGAKSHGRKVEYYSSKAKDAQKKGKLFFPSSVDGGLLKMKATSNGAINILAFDSDFKDNAGSYDIGLVITRSNPPSGKSSEQLYLEMLAAGPTGYV